MKGEPMPAEGTPNPRGARHPQERSWWSEVKDTLFARPPRRPSKSIPPQTRFSLWYFVVALVLMFIIQGMWLAETVHRLSYSEFKQLVKAGEVTEASIGEQNISGKFKVDELAKVLPETRVNELNKQLKGDTNKARDQGDVTPQAGRHGDRGACCVDWGLWDGAQLAGAANAGLVVQGRTAARSCMAAEVRRDELRVVLARA